MSWRTTWPTDPLAASARLNERYPDAGASYLLVTAAYTVEGLHYLSEVDARLPSYWPSGHTPEGASVDLAHARWAVADAITAIDLCAGALGRIHRGYPKTQYEMDFRQAAKDQKLAALPEPNAWLRSVGEDPEYGKVEALRHALVHRTVRRPIHMALGKGARRGLVQLEDNGDVIEIHDEVLVPLCRDLALRHVAEFVARIDAL